MNEGLYGIGLSSEQAANMKRATNRPPDVAPAPMLVSLVDQINKHLDAIRERQAVVGSAIDRITGPKPLGAGAAGCEKAPEQSHEARLRAILSRLDDVLQAEASHADALNGMI